MFIYTNNSSIKVPCKKPLLIPNNIPEHASFEPQTTQFSALINKYFEKVNILQIKLKEQEIEKKNAKDKEDIDRVSTKTEGLQNQSWAE